MSYPDPFSMCVAFVPLTIYLLVLGANRAFGRAIVISGGVEVLMMGLAIAGFVAVGPAQLFFPQAAVMVFGWKVWLMLAAFYVLCLLLVALTVRPRVSIVGRTSDEAFPAVVRAAQSIDNGAEIDERKMEVFLPAKSIRLRLDAIPKVDHVSVLAFEPRIPHRFWPDFSRALKQEIKTTQSVSDGRGLGVLGWAAALIAWLIYQVVPATDQFADGFRQWLLHQ